MSEHTILVIGRHPEIMGTVLRLINARPGWTAKGTTRLEEAVLLFDQEDFDLVLLGGGVGGKDEAFLRSSFLSSKPGVPVIQHFGGGSGLLFNEIDFALGKSGI